MLSVYFAPLQGFTEAAYRRAHAEFAGGITAYYAPFLRVEKGCAREKDLRNLLCDTAQGPLPHYRLIPQIIVKDAAEFRILVDVLLQNGFSGIDVNMGCPFPMQTKAGRGAGILPHPEKVSEILEQINCYADKATFSLKMRLGLESANESLALLPLLNATPLSHITLHPRLGIQQYKGEVDREFFRTFHAGCTRPLIYNGDISSVSEICTLEKEFPKLAGVMLGRGLLARPTLAAEYASGNETNSCSALLKIHAAVFSDYRNRLQGDAQILDKIRPFWTYVDLPKKIAKTIQKTHKLAEYEAAVAEIG